MTTTTTNRYAILATWERNGYDDSDFYAALWDREEMAVKAVMTDTTRFGGGPQYPDGGVDPAPTDDDALSARAWMEEAIFGELRYAEHRDVNEPSISALRSAANGDVRVLADHRYRPRNKRYEPADFKAGDVVRLVRIDHYGTFYRNGYNQPGRHNGSALVQSADGRMGRVPTSKLGLAREPMSDTELRSRARRISWEGQVHKVAGCRAWASSIELEPVLKRLRSSEAVA